MIGYWIVQGQWEPALVSLAVAGWSDWLDGYLARRFNQVSVLGTYLDPLADKVRCQQACSRALNSGLH